MKISFENITPLFQTYKCEIILGLCSLFLAYVIATSIKRARSNFPPGPMGLPLVGYMPFLTSDTHLDLIQLGKKYGDVFSIKLGWQDILIVNGADAALEALNKSEFLGRPSGNAFEKTLPSSAFFGSNFILWKDQRRAVVKFMQDLGLGKPKIVKNLMDEINYFMDVLRNSETQPIDIRKPLCSSLSNNISFLVFGKRLKYDDPKKQFLDNNMKDFFKYFNQICLDVCFPWISYIPFASKFLQFHKARTVIKKYEKFFIKEINEHLKCFNPADVRDFTDLYLEEIEKQRVKNPDTSFNQNMLIAHAIDLLITGSETVIATFLWCIYIIAAFPDVQKKVQKEIMEVIGPDRTPEYIDMRNMPYIRAVMMEIMRWKAPIPLTGQHSPLADTTVAGYSIQRGTTVIYNLWAFHHDPRNWDEPEKFKPERFLSEDGKSVVKPRNFIPFLAGGRVCPGQPMAYLELFLYLTSILREFDIAFPDNTEPTFNGEFRSTYRPEPYLVRFIPKN